jgi:hypothetical protein
VGPKAGLDTEARGRLLSPLPRIEPPSPGSPARSRHYTELPRITHNIYYSLLFKNVYLKETVAKTVLSHAAHHDHLDSQGAVAVSDAE